MLNSIEVISHEQSPHHHHKVVPAGVENLKENCIFAFDHGWSEWMMQLIAKLTG